MNKRIKNISFGHGEVFVPMPVLPVIEDVGWWQGEDGSALQQPYRNAFPRRHCLADYRALVRLARRLGVRIGLGMVLGEWDREKVLAEVPGATWLGRDWDNRANLGPWLEEAADYLRANRDFLELGVHGLCHEFWDNGAMERSEFHDREGTMRPAWLIRAHLDAFGKILEHNGFSGFPRLFLPPALYHSCGNGEHSMQAILRSYGVDAVITRFARTRFFVPPHHETLTWECGVGLLERGLSPVPWHQAASRASWDFSGPILPLHWSNLLHPDPQLHADIVDDWASLLLAGTAGPERILAEDFGACWRQMLLCHLVSLSLEDEAVVIDCGLRPQDMPGPIGPFWLKIRDSRQVSLSVLGAQILDDRRAGPNIRAVQLLPGKGTRRIFLEFS